MEAIPDAALGAIAGVPASAGVVATIEPAARKAATAARTSAELASIFGGGASSTTLSFLGERSPVR
jgi:hypothetical protein